MNMDGTMGEMVPGGSVTVAQCRDLGGFFFIAEVGRCSWRLVQVSCLKKCFRSAFLHSAITL